MVIKTADCISDDEMNPYLASMCGLSEVVEVSTACLPVFTEPNLH
jgi:hypothetical protein